jgi:hypothetical protein
MSLMPALSKKACSMKELLRTTDIVLLTYVNSLLNDACVPVLIADVHVSSVEGSIGAFPRRVLVAAEDWDESISVLTAAGLGDHLIDGSLSRSLAPL